MPSIIKRLDAHTINKIAAGEVIENPASVVKELVENSIDAKAKKIIVEIITGGRKLIRVTDDGMGMSQEDALLCLERHATSKIREMEDIFTLSTMGFRGEAIPSIASISKLTLHTSNGEQAMLLITEGGEIQSQSSAARDKGTTFAINDLFFNVPVRKKFQRSPSYDTQQISRVLTLQALAHPEICFQLLADGKLLLKTSYGTEESFIDLFKQRIGEMFGDDLSKKLLKIQAEGLQGWICPPSLHRHNRTGHHLFINRRPVFSPFVSAILRESFGTTLPTGRYPLFFLHLDLAGDLVDVNVHPQKKEVRLREQERLKKLLFCGVDSALFPKTPSPAFSFTPTAKWEPVESFKYTKTQAPMERQEMFAFTPLERSTHQKVLAAIPNYILLQEETGGLILVDQRAAHMRVLYEKHLQQGARMETQTLTVPYTIELLPQEADLIRERIPCFLAIGLDLQEFGQNSFILHSRPSFLTKKDPETLLREMVSLLQDQEDAALCKQEKEKQVARAAALMRLAKNKVLSLFEAEALVRDLFSCKQKEICPFGKATFATWKPHDLACVFANK